MLSPHDPFRAMKHLQLFVYPAFASRASVLISSLHKRAKQRMGLQRLRLEFRMELAAQKIRMIGQFDDLHVSPIRSCTGDLHSGAGQDGFILTIEFVAM